MKGYFKQQRAVHKAGELLDIRQRKAIEKQLTAIK